MSKFKIQGVGLDTTTINFNPGKATYTNRFEYIYTTIDANNDYLVAEYIKSLSGYPPLITSIDFLDNFESILTSHLGILGRDKVDILLLRDNIDLSLIGNLKNNPIYSRLGLYEPTNIKEKVEELKKEDLYVEYVMFNVCPLDFNLEDINYCEENDITIIGKNPFGGYLSAPRNITTFTVPYLLGFSANYSNIVVVSGRDLFLANENSSFLHNLIDTESSNEYVLRKSTKKVVKELKKVIYSSLRMDGNSLTIPYDDPELMILPDNFKPNIGSYVEEMTLLSSPLMITNYLDVIKYPSDCNRDVKFAIARYRAVDYLKKSYKEEEGWYIDLVKIGSSVLLITVKKDPKFKGMWFWKTLVPGESKNYYLILPMGDGDLIFRDVEENANKTDQIPYE